jgi:protein-S-isoprenylcysteine O-methyltransferase Ste14
MRATDFEFRYRFWFILSIFLLAFSCYTFDHRDVVAEVLRRFFQHDRALEFATARHWFQISFAFSAILVTKGAFMRTWGSAYLRVEVVHDSVVRTEKLVADGPFRYVRNPLYLGNLVMAAGVGMFATPIGWLVLVLGQTIFVLRLIGREEAGLVESQGDAHRAYQAAVPRLFPASIRPRVPAGGIQPRWLQGFLGEAWMWVLALDGFIFAWRLDVHLYYTILWVCVAGYFIRWIALKVWRRRRPV